MFIVEHLNRFFELHVLNLRMADRLLAFKKDHFNNWLGYRIKNKNTINIIFNISLTFSLPTFN